MSYPQPPPPGWPAWAESWTGCGKPGCTELCWILPNYVEWGMSRDMESWEGWCPEHGDFQGNYRGTVWLNELPIPEMTDAWKARYCGFTIDEFKRHLEMEAV